MAGKREARAQPPVERVAVREEHRERVGAAVEEDGDEDALRACGASGRDALLERAREQRRAAVDGERQAGAAREEAAPVEAGSGRDRHAGLDRRQPATGLGRSAAHQVGAREVGAAAGHQQVWRSGETATSWRSAFAVRNR